MNLLLSAGRGPAECAWALRHLVRRLEQDAARHRVTVVRVSATERSVLLELTGDGAGDFARGWTGTLCWQAPSPYRKGHGRKNWYVIAEPCSTEVPHTRWAESDVDVTGVRTGGPGGQHRNKASTAARAVHRPTGLVVVADTERQFGQNRRIALDLLRRRLAERDAAAGRAAVTARWEIHDDLIRGNPTRIERP
jgi:peptide chain release factor